ncbi:MAG: Uncharacterised protein [Halieaceae bacterium]|nr:MAG: Uncharacterised protein [Halieaceae bacterium]
MERGSLGIANHDRANASVNGAIDHFGDRIHQLIPETDITAEQNVDLLKVFLADLFETLHPAFGGDAVKFRYGIKVGEYSGVGIH